MAVTAVKVKGLRETQRAFRRIDRDLSRTVREGLRKAAEPVRAEAQSLFSSIDPRSASGYRVRVRQRGIAVEQRYGRTTGQHPEFGALQMVRALIPARERKQGQVIEGLEKALDDLADRAGF